MKKETIFILILIIFIFILSIGSIIKYLNDTVFEEGKINLVNTIKIGKYFLMFCIFSFITYLFFKQIIKIKGWNRYSIYYFGWVLITLSLSLMYLFTFIMETINMTDTPDDNKTIDGWEWTQITKLGGVLSALVALVVLIIIVKKTINVNFIDVVDNIWGWLLLLICVPFLICILIGFILWMNKATNITNSDNYDTYKYTLNVMTIVIYGLICFSSEIVQNGNIDKIFKNNIVVVGGWRLVTSWAYVPYKYIKEIILKFLHSCHSNAPYKEEYKFEL